VSVNSSPSLRRRRIIHPLAREQQSNGRTRIDADLLGFARWDATRRDCERREPCLHVITAIFMHACPRVYEERASIPNGDRLTFIAATSARARGARVATETHARMPLRARCGLRNTRSCAASHVPREVLSPLLFPPRFFSSSKAKVHQCTLHNNEPTSVVSLPKLGSPLGASFAPRNNLSSVSAEEKKFGNAERITCHRGSEGGGAETGRFARAREEYFTTKLFIFAFVRSLSFFFISFINELQNRLQNRSASTG